MTKVNRRALTAANSVVMWLQRLGVVLGPMQVLTLRGRRTGVARSVPVAVVAVDGNQYVFQAYPRAAWVANARAAGAATLGRGRRRAEVSLVELTVADRVPVLRALVAASPSVARRFAANGLASAPTVAGVLDAAPRIAVFRVDDPAPAT